MYLPRKNSNYSPIKLADPCCWLQHFIRAFLFHSECPPPPHPPPVLSTSKSYLFAKYILLCKRLHPSLLHLFSTLHVLSVLLQLGFWSSMFLIISHAALTCLETKSCVSVPGRALHMAGIQNSSQKEGRVGVVDRERERE